MARPVTTPGFIPIRVVARNPQAVRLIGRTIKQIFDSSAAPPFQAPLLIRYPLETLARELRKVRDRYQPEPWAGWNNPARSAGEEGGSLTYRYREPKAAPWVNTLILRAQTRYYAKTSCLGQLTPPCKELWYPGSWALPIGESFLNLTGRGHFEWGPARQAANGGLPGPRPLTYISHDGLPPQTVLMAWDMGPAIVAQRAWISDRYPPPKGTPIAEGVVDSRTQNDPAPMLEPLPEFLPQIAPMISPFRTLPQTLPEVEPLPLEQPAPPPLRPPIEAPPLSPVKTPGEFLEDQKKRELEQQGTAIQRYPLGQPGIDGNPKEPEAPPVKQTKPGALIIPGAEIEYQPVRPDIGSIAIEVGKLEAKAEYSIGNPYGPPDLGFLDDLLRRIADLTPEENLDLRPFPGGTWTVADACAMRPPEDVGQVGVGVADQRGFEAAVLARFTALAQLLQLQKSRSGPVCTGPVLNGRAVTVHFVSDETSPRSRNLLRKQLTYRVQVGGSLESSTAHWAGFTWQAGDVVVIHEGTPAGNLKVFASTEAEGRRVVSHALADAGIDPAKRGEWKVTQTRGSRLGLSGTMRTAPTSTGGYAVTSRTASDGPAYVVTGPV